MIQAQISGVLWSALGLALGGVIGYTFGLIQDAALRRNQKREAEGKFNNGWAVMPKSMGRVVYLVMALGLVQVLCPMLFADGFQWWVSGGVVTGYGLLLSQQLRRRLSQDKL